MATASNNYGANTALTVTNLQSLGSNSWWQSAAVDNGTIKAIWAEIFVTIATTTTAGTDGTVEVYMAESTDSGTDFSGGASGTEGSYTVVGNSNEQLRLIGVVAVDASEVTARTYKAKITVHDLPANFSLVAKNVTGTALASSGNAVEYRLNKYDSA